MDLFSYTEKDWNVDSIPHVEKHGIESQGGHSYQASKTLAEKALWSESSDNARNIAFFIGACPDDTLRIHRR
jgi:hypothetical protein